MQESNTKRATQLTERQFVSGGMDQCVSDNEDFSAIFAKRSRGYHARKRKHVE